MFDRHFKFVLNNFKKCSLFQKRILHKQININNGRNMSSVTNNIRQDREQLLEKRKVLSINEYMKYSIKYTHLNKKGNILYLSFEGTEDLEYPVIWLRDNCQCNECFDFVSHSRIHAPLSFTDDIIPKFITSDENTLSVTWADGHISKFRKKWLCEHSFHIEHQTEREKKQQFQPVLWNAKEILNMLPTISFFFDDIINDDNILLNWLRTLATIGVAKIYGAPAKIGQLSILASRISFIRKTHYGEEYYIKSNSDYNNVAYKKGALQLHTDLPYYNFAPGVVLLHFIKQSRNGGENILVDGFNSVKQLMPKTVDILSKTYINWIDIGSENGNKFHSVNKAPVIQTDYLGNVERINWSQPQRDSIFNVTLESAMDWYDGYKEFSKIIHDNKNGFTIKSSEGNVLTFDNRRIIHGRNDYSDQERFLCGAYIDWDEIYSKIRVLQQDLEIKNQLN